MSEFSQANNFILHKTYQQLLIILSDDETEWRERRKHDWVYRAGETVISLIILMFGICLFAGGLAGVILLALYFPGNYDPIIIVLWIASFMLIIFGILIGIREYKKQRLSIRRFFKHLQSESFQDMTIYL